MTYSTEMNEIVEERYQFCILLNIINRNTDKINKEKWEIGEKTQIKLDIFTIPNHIKKMFGEFLKTPLYTEIKTLDGHTDGVSCMTFHENKLYSGNYDKTIRVCNTETYEQIANLRGHTGEVYCFTLNENKLYSGSGDNTIRVWNIFKL
jgi:WD40 repeat protein